MAAVASSLFRSQRLWEAPGQPCRLPATETARHRSDVSIAKLSQRFRAENAPDAPSAVEDNRYLTISNRVLDAHLQKTAWNVNRAGDDPLIDFILLSNIDQHCSLIVQSSGLPHVDLAHGLPLAFEHFLIGLHCCLPNRRILELVVKFRWNCWFGRRGPATNRLTPHNLDRK